MEVMCAEKKNELKKLRAVYNVKPWKAIMESIIYSDFDRTFRLEGVDL
jgi:hypothetical protein